MPYITKTQQKFKINVLQNSDQHNKNKNS